MTKSHPLNTLNTHEPQREPFPSLRTASNSLKRSSLKSRRKFKRGLSAFKKSKYYQNKKLKRLDGSKKGALVAKKVLKKKRKSVVDPKDHECPVCLSLIRDKVKLSVCGHIFCERCINKLRPKEEQGELRECPQCRSCFGPKEVEKDEKYASKVHKMTFKCSYCLVKGKYSDFKNHLCDIPSEVERKNSFSAKEELVPKKNTVTFECPYCRSKNFDREGLIEHVNKLHEDEGYAVCPICTSFNFGDPEYKCYLPRHLRRRHKYDIGDLYVSF